MQIDIPLPPPVEEEEEIHWSNFLSDNFGSNFVATMLANVVNGERRNGIPPRNDDVMIPPRSCFRRRPVVRVVVRVKGEVIRMALIRRSGGDGSGNNRLLLVVVLRGNDDEED